MTATLGSFRHGVHPPEHKELTARERVRRLPFPAEVVLPLRQHAGAPAQCLVRAGDRVERGQFIAESGKFYSTIESTSASLPCRNYLAYLPLTQSRRRPPEPKTAMLGFGKLLKCVLWAHRHETALKRDDSGVASLEEPFSAVE